MKAFHILVVFLLLSTFVLALDMSDPVASAKGVTSRILCLVSKLAPYITLSMIIMGGITYISAGDDEKQRILGKKFIIMGIVGQLCVIALVAMAGSEPFGINLGSCEGIFSGAGAAPSSGSHLITPAPGSLYI